MTGVALRSSTPTNWETLASLIRSVPAWVLITDMDGVVQLVNQRAAGMAGLNPEQMIGQSWPYPWLHDLRWAEHPGRVSDSLAYGNGDAFYPVPRWPGEQLREQFGPLKLEGVCGTGAGERRALEITLSTISDEGSAPQNVMMIGWDVTERQVRQEDLSQLQKTQLVSQLASGVAHDINNNLAVILGYAEFLLSGCDTLDSSVQDALKAILEQSEACAETVRRIQLFSRPVPKSRFSRFEVNQVVEDAIRSVVPNWDPNSGWGEGDVRVCTRLAESPTMEGYAQGLKEALQSLISNAVDSMPQGGTVDINSRIQSGQLTLEIADSGVGIPGYRLDRVFDAFFTSKGPSYSGLGLSIAKNLITQQGGKIDIESEEGAGTRVTITLSVENANRGPSVVEEAGIGARQLSILVVDDETLVADVYRTFLQAFGHEPTVFNSGKDALEEFRTGKFDLALLDIGMPEMDGWELSRRLHQVDPDLPVILATGWDLSLEDGDQYGAQVQAVLRKPFNMQDLSEALVAVQTRS